MLQVKLATEPRVAFTGDGDITVMSALVRTECPAESVMLCNVTTATSKPCIKTYTKESVPEVSTDSLAGLC